MNLFFPGWVPDAPVENGDEVRLTSTPLFRRGPPNIHSPF